MEDIFDLAIIGGGTNGYATFLTAASAGLKTILLEKDLVGQKANYASLGMIQPGLKYLKSDLDLVEMDALDCRLLKMIAGDLLQPQPFVLPIFEDYPFPLSKQWFWEIYLNAYDQFSCLSLHPAHCLLEQHEIKEWQRQFSKKISGGIVFEEWLTDPLQLAEKFTSAGKLFGGRVLEQMKVVGFEKIKNKKGFSLSAVICQNSSGQVEKIKARCFINASGAWTTQIIKLLGITSALKLRPTRGTSVIVGRKLFESGLIFFDESKRYLALLPQPDGTLIGPTNYDVAPAIAENPDLLQPKKFEIAELLAAANRFLKLDTPLSSQDIVRVKYGLRPQLQHRKVAPENITHQFTVFDHQPEKVFNFISVCGGKLTSLLRISKEATELVCQKLDRPFEWKIPYLRLDRGQAKVGETPFCPPEHYFQNYALTTARSLKQGRLKSWRKQAHAIFHLISNVLFPPSSCQE